MVNWGENTVPIIVALIGIVGVVAPTLLSNQIFNKPDVDVGIYTNGNKAKIGVSNDGWIPATNISLLIEAKVAKFTDITYKFGTANIEIPQIPPSNSTLQINKTTGDIDSHFLELKIPKLIQGSGSKTEMVVSLDRDQKEKDYRIAVTYDQGSSDVLSNNPLEELGSMIFYNKNYYIVLGIIMSILGLTIYYKKRKKSPDNTHIDSNKLNE
ncbi:MAG TPA: hypothetical protein VKA95_14285 [Nitrososphaeraceae archaeon]|nr:hypothetical protein [Nitrososphaeraceae archaeon]